MREEKLLKRLKVIFIDWNKTLCSDELFHNLPEISTELFEKIDYRLFEEMPLEAFADWMRGKITQEDVAYYLAGNDLNPQEILHLLKMSCEKMYVEIFAYWKWIKKLRNRGIKIVVATDNIDSFVKYTVPSLKLDKKFDAILCSAELHCLKTDCRKGKLLFFDDFLRKNGINYSEAILLDDEIEKIKVCKKCGMQAKRVSSPEEVLRLLMLIEAGYGREVY